MTTPESLRRTIEGYLNELVKLELVIAPSAITVEADLVTWAAPKRQGSVVDFSDSITIGNYRRWAIEGDYTALLYDGGLLQLGYRMVGGDVVEHRLLYVPCPYMFDQLDLARDPIEDLLELHQLAEHNELAMQTAIRFDYAPGNAKIGHPVTHLTINLSSCRIPVEAPMHPAQFLRFVFEHFYSADWTKHRGFFDGLTSRFEPSSVTDDERLMPHIAWRAS